MRKRMLNNSIKRFALVFSVVFLFAVSSAMAVTRNVPADYATIQAAINAASAGDTIDVAAGTYNEDLTINKRVTINGTGASTTTINGVHTITNDDVTIKGFTLAPGSGIAVTIDSSGSIIDTIAITNNIFDLTTSPSIGVWLGGGTCNNKVMGITISNNEFNGPSDKVCNPWKIGGWFGTPIGCEVEDVNFEGNTVNKCSTPINLHDEGITDVLINNNIFRNTDGVVYVWEDAGENPTGVLSQFVFTNNDVDSTNSYGVGIDTASPPVFDSSNFGSGNMINNNKFVGIPGAYGFKSVSILSTLNPYTLNAERNYWGSADPSFDLLVSDNVDYDPWYVDAGMSTLSEVFANLDAAVSSRASQESVDVVESKLDAHLDTAVSSRASQESVDAIESKLDSETGLPAIYSFILSIYNLIYESVIPQIESIEGKLDIDLDVPVSSRASQESVSALSEDVAAIETKIDEIEVPIPQNLAIESEPGIIESGVASIESKLDDPNIYKANVEGLATESSPGAIESKIDALDGGSFSAIEAKLDDEGRFTDDEELAIVEGKIDAIEGKADSIEGKVDNLEILDYTSVIAAIEEKLDVPDNFKADVSGLATSSEVAAVETKVDALPDNTEAIAAIEGKLDDDVYGLEEIKSEVATIESGVSSVEGKIDALPDPIPALESIEGKLDAFDGGSFGELRTKIDAVEVKLDDETRFTDDIEIAAIETKIDAVEEKLDTGLDVPVGTRASQASVDAIESKIDELETGDIFVIVNDIQNIVNNINNNILNIITNINTIINTVNIINTGVGSVESKLDDPNTGLAEIKSEVSSIENKIDNNVADKDDVDDLNDRIDNIENQLGVLEAKLDSLVFNVSVRRCGNNIIDPGEQCDDGNNLNGDGCSGTCLVEQCGNGRLDLGEQCDDGDTDSGDGCNVFCQVEQCQTDDDCEGKAVCNEVFRCVGGEMVVVFRTNVIQGDYFKCRTGDNCWIAIDHDGDGDLEALGFQGKSSKCNGGTPIVKTPEGYNVLDYGHATRVRLCDGEGREIRFGVDEVPQDVELSTQPTEPFTSNNQETLV